jgi:phenylalanyl-tRNA synthetase alpha chain
MQELQKILDDALQSFAAIEDAAELENAKARYLGKEGSLTGLLKGLGKLSAEERPAAGARINQVKQQIEAALNAQRDAIQNRALNAKLAAESYLFPGDFARHLRQIVSRSRGTRPFSFRGLGGSS